jgi:hypothetical protein
MRKGEPLSLFLFLIVVEGLNIMMNALVKADLFIGYKVGNSNMVSITHLQFADDTLLIGVKRKKIKRLTLTNEH